MEDLGSISKALQDVLHAPSADDDTFVQLVQTYLKSADPGVRRLVLEVLYDVITEGTPEELEVRRRFIFENTVLTYIPLLLPLHRDAPDLITSLVEACLDVCSPREAILALNEACQLLEERAEGYEVSDDGLGMGSGDDDEADMEELGDQLCLVIMSYAQVFARMPGIKSTPTLLTVSDAVSSCLTALVPGCGSIQAISILLAVMRMLQTAYEWVGRSSDAGGEQRAILIQLFYMSITLIFPQTSPQTLQTWFLFHYPQYALSRASPSISAPSAESSLSSHIQAITSLLGHDTEHLLLLISQKSSISRISPHAPLAALNLIASQIVDSERKEPISLPDLDEMVVLISSGLSGSAVDAASTILWEIVYRYKEGDVEVDHAMPLIELLMPLTTSDPNPLHRLAYFKLIQALIEKSSGGTDQIMLLQQLLEPANPYDTLKPQALSILRDMLVRASSSPSSSTILQPALLTNVPLLPSSKHLSLPDDGFLDGPIGVFVTDQLTTVRLLYQLDKDDRTGVKSEKFGEEAMRVVGVIGEKLRGWQARKVTEGVSEGSWEGAGDEAMKREFTMMRLHEAFYRLSETIGRSESWAMR